MNTLRPFFLLIGRASVFWLGAVGLFALSITVAGLAQPDERLGMYFDAAFVAAFIFPAAAGWLAGAVIQEFQHTTLAMVLPGARYRIASGFLTTGLAVTVVAVCSVALASSAPQNLAMLFVVGLAAFCLGGIFVDPLSGWITPLTVSLTFFVVAFSGPVARTAGDHPWMTIGTCFGIGVAGFFRLFARSTFRRKPDRATHPLPGRFSVEKTRLYERQRMIRSGPRGAGWRAGYLEDDARHWVRAAIHEVHGFRGWRDVWRIVNRFSAFGFLVVVYAWADRADMGVGEAVARSIHDALFRSPFVPEFGEKGGPFLFVALALAATGVVMALFSPVSLGDGMAYPLSRRRRAEIHFRCGLVDGAILLLLVGPVLLALGHLAGWFAGHEARFDFLPFFYRVLLITVILMPLAYWGRVQLVRATRQKSENTMVGLIFGVVGFTIVACVWVFLSPVVFSSQPFELIFLVVALLFSQWVYRQKLISYYRTADLA